MASCGADIEANRLLPALTQDAVFPIPDVDLSGLVFPDDGLKTPVIPLKVSDITDGIVTGPGAFDALMRGFKAHLQEEFDANRITGDDYTKAYIALTESAMGQSIAFLMGKDQTFWASQLIQVQAFSERVRLEIAKVEVAATQYNAATQKANYAKTKMEVASEEVNYCTATYNLENLLPSQLAKLELENLGQTTENSISAYNLSSILPEQLAMALVQKAGQEIANNTSTYNLSNILPKQVEKLTLENSGQTLQNSTIDFNLTQMLPEQLAILGLEKTGQVTANEIADYNLSVLLPEQFDTSLTQKAGQEIANNTATYNLATVLPKQTENLGYQGEMLKEQTEAQRAQTLDVRKDGAPVVGVLGKQKDLYAQQITSYQRDAELKAARIWSDAWITQKTIDEGLLPPDTLTNTKVDAVLESIRINNNLG